MSSIKFVGLHAHSGVGSPFDGFGFPQDHMDFGYNCTCQEVPDMSRLCSMVDT